MNWMMKCGYISQIYNVKIKYPDKDKLIKIYAEEGVNSAMESVNPELVIIDYNYSMSEGAERLTSNRKNFLRTAQMTFPWDDLADSFYLD
jgi:RecA-family ATPase